MSLKNLTIKNIGITYLSFGLSKIIGFVSLIILSRLLLPSEFGIVALASSATALISQFSDIGIGSALIQKKENKIEAAECAFIMYIFLGIVLFLIAAIIAPFASDFFNESAIMAVIWVSSLGLIINSFGITHGLLLRKDLNFKKITIVDLAVATIGTITTILLALLNFSYWSIIFGSLIAKICEIILLWHFNPWRPRLVFNFEVAKEMLNFSKYLVISNLLVFILLNIDNITAGKILGVTTVGIYMLAFKFGNYSTTLITHVVTRVLFPTFSKIQDDIERLKRGYLLALKYVSMLSIPAAIGTIAISTEFVTTLMGENWLAVIPVLPILCLYGLFRSVSADAGNIFYAVGKPQIGTKIMAIVVIITLIIIYPATKLFGIIGLSIAMTFSMFIAMILQLFTVNKILNMPNFSQLKLFNLPLISSIFMFVCIKAASSLFQNFNIVFSNGINLFILIFIGILSYSLALVIFTGGNILKEIYLIYDRKI